MEGSAVFQDQALAMFMRVSAFGGPAKEGASELAATATASPTGELPASVGSLRQMFVTATSVEKLSFKTVRKVLMKMIKSAAKKAAEAGKAATTKSFYQAQAAGAQRVYDKAAKKLADAAEKRAKAKITADAKKKATKDAKEKAKKELAEQTAEETRDIAEKKALDDGIQKFKDNVVDAAATEALNTDRRGESALSVGLLQSLIGDLQHDVVGLWFDTMRTQCDGFAQVLGSANPVAQLVKQACLLGPDGLEGMLAALLVLVVDYPAMHCVCKLPEGQTVLFVFYILFV